MSEKHSAEAPRNAWLNLSLENPSHAHHHFCKKKDTCIICYQREMLEMLLLFLLMPSCQACHCRLLQKRPAEELEEHPASQVSPQDFVHKVQSLHSPGGDVGRLWELNYGCTDFCSRGGLGFGYSLRMSSQGPCVRDVAPTMILEEVLEPLRGGTQKR